MGKRQMRDDVADLGGIGPGGLHALLYLAHLARRHRFHGLGNLLRALDARNLGAYFLSACHVSTLLPSILFGRALPYQVPVALKSSTAARSAASISSL